MAATGHGRVPALLGFSGALAMTWLAGFPPYAAPVTLIAGLYLATLVVRHWREAGARPAAGLAGFYTAAVLLGFGLAAVQLLPMFAFFPESNRTVSPTIDSIASQTFDVAGLLGLALPSPFGHPNLTSQMPYEHSPLPLLLFTQESWQVSPAHQSYPLFPPRYNFIEYAVFPGTLALLLAAAGAWFRGFRFWLFAVAVSTFLIMLAVGAWPVRGLYALPGFKNVPASRFIGPLCALLAPLAAMGLARLTYSGASARGHWFGAGGLVLSGLCAAAWWWLRDTDPELLYSGWTDDILAYYRRNPSLQNVPDAAAASYVVVNGQSVLPLAHRLVLDNLVHGGVAFLGAGLWFLAQPFAIRSTFGRRALAAVAIVATVAQLLWVAQPISGGRELPHAHRTAIHEFLREQNEAARATGGFMVARGAKAPQFPVQLPTCTLVPYRIRDLNIYTFTDNRAHKLFEKLYGRSQLYRDFWVAALPDDDRIHHPLLDFFGVRYVLSTVRLSSLGDPVGPTWSGPQGEFLIYERPTAMPRAVVVPDLRVVDTETAVIDAMVDPQFSPRDYAVVTRDQATALAESAANGESIAKDRTVRFVRDHPADVLLEVDAGAPGYLVLSDTLMSGWQATINGEHVPILRANLFARAVPIPPHAVQVRFAYEAPKLLSGAIVAVVSLAIPAARTPLVLDRKTDRSDDLGRSRGSPSMTDKRRVLVRQQREWSEILLPFEATNRYLLFDENDEQIGSAAESGGGVGRGIARQFLGGSRRATIHIFDRDGDEIGRVEKPFRLYFQSVDVFDGEERLGTIERRFSLLHRKFVIRNADGDEVCEIFSPLFRIWTFKVLFDGVEVGRISKKWSGLFTEMMSDADTFGIEYEALPDLEALRPLLIAAVFLVDFTCFENNRNNR